MFFTLAYSDNDMGAGAGIWYGFFSPSAKTLNNNFNRIYLQWFGEIPARSVEKIKGDYIYAEEVQFNLNNNTCIVVDSGFWHRNTGASWNYYSTQTGSQIYTDADIRYEFTLSPVLVKLKYLLLREDMYEEPNGAYFLLGTGYYTAALRAYHTTTFYDTDYAGIHYAQLIAKDIVDTKGGGVAGILGIGGEYNVFYKFYVSADIEYIMGTISELKYNVYSRDRKLEGQPFTYTDADGKVANFPVELNGINLNLTGTYRF